MGWLSTIRSAGPPSRSDTRVTTSRSAQQGGHGVRHVAQPDRLGVPSRRLSPRATNAGWLTARRSASPVTMLPSGRTATTAGATTA